MNDPRDYDEATQAKIAAQEIARDREFYPAPRDAPGVRGNGLEFRTLPIKGFSEGVKFDTDKSRHDLIAPELPDYLGLVLAYGAAKYEARNWEKGMSWGRPFAAAMRHLWAWWRGERCDPETGLPHLAHAACNVMFLLTFEQRGIGTDDRYQAPPDVGT